MSAAKGLALTALQQNIPANVRLGWRVQLIAERTRSLFQLKSGRTSAPLCRD